MKRKMCFLLTSRSDSRAPLFSTLDQPDELDWSFRPGSGAQQGGKRTDSSSFVNLADSANTLDEPPHFFSFQGS